MKIKEFFKNFNIFSKKYLIFVFLIILAITIVHNILVYVSYRSHKDSLKKNIFLTQFSRAIVMKFF